MRHLVVAFPLGDDALAVLGDRLGHEFAVRDIRTDGPAPDIVLVPPCSPQAIAHLKHQFDGAAVVIVELEDLLVGVNLGGPVSRSLRAGADAYYVAPSTEALGTFLAALPLPTIGALAEQDQPVALPAAPTPEPVPRSDPAPDP